MRARRVLFAVLIVFLLPQASHAQVLIGILLGDKVTTESFHLGVEIGADVSNLTGIDGSRHRPGFVFGLVAEWRFAPGFYLQPGILPFYQTGARSLPMKPLGVPQLDSLVTDRSAARRLKYFAVPVVVKVGLLEEKLHLGAGPQVNFLLSANDTYEGVVRNEISVKEDIADRLTRADAGIAFHAEYKLHGRYGSSLTARYYLGLSDTTKDGSGISNRVWSILFTIPIGGDPTRVDPGD